MIERLLNNRYLIEKKIGSGGMALVFQGRDNLLERKIAIKLLRPQFTSDANFTRKFTQEARAVASLNHPHIVSVFDIGVDNDNHYLVMEYIEGENLKEVINKGALLPQAFIVRVLKEICEALATAHKNDIIHCDIKPHNILITKENGIKVADFGIARAVSSVTTTYTSSILGTAQYISPEQAKGDRVTSASDLYSLGVVAYEMATNQLPFAGESPISIALKHIREQVISPAAHRRGLNKKLEKIIMKALAKDTKQRYKTSEEMLKDLEQVEKELSLTTDSEQNNDSATTKIIDHRELSQKQNAQQKTILGQQALKVKKALTAAIPRLKPEKESAPPSAKNKSGRQVKPQKSSTTFFQNNKYYLLSLLILVFALVGGWTFYKLYMDVPIVRVPDVVASSYVQAQQLLKGVGLDYTIEGDQYHSQIPMGHIIEQYPRAEVEVRNNRVVNLIVSRGPVWNEIPDLIGITLREAEIFLESLELEIGKVEYEANDEIPRNLIFKQSPEAGERTDQLKAIDIVISEGRAMFALTVPNLTGLSQEEAENSLLERGLSLGDILEEKSYRFLEGQIMEQKPPAGAEVNTGQKVDLVISSGIYNPEGAPIYQPGIRVPVPYGAASQEVMIVIEDLNGRTILYEGNHQGGDLIFQRANTVGATVIEIYINGNLKQEERIGF